MAQFHILSPGDVAHESIEVRRITLADIGAAVRDGWQDFMARPSHYIFVVLVYPAVGLALVAWAAGGDALQLIYPLVTGFALLGPIAALPLYEISRRREHGADTGWADAMAVVRSPAIPSVAAVGFYLLVLFFVWIYAAETIFGATYGGREFDSLGALFSDVFTTPRGWTLLIVGNLVGFCFALLVLTTTAIAFPLLLDRDVGAVAAIGASVKAMRMNPLPMLAWGLIVAVLLFVGAVPMFGGLIVVLPLLGHATWHVYRRVVADGAPARPVDGRVA